MVWNAWEKIVQVGLAEGAFCLKGKKKSDYHARSADRAQLLERKGKGNYGERKNVQKGKAQWIRKGMCELGSWTYNKNHGQALF